MEKNEKFYVGLDIGTTSVGFSATDGNYQVLKYHGVPMMGSRIFEEANTAAKRRVIRANKVRMARKKQRISLLQELFNDEIAKIDPLFYTRLSASSFWADDKISVNDQLDLNSLFSGSTFNDKTYFSKYKTIYHLRSALTDEKTWSQGTIPDIRLVYLACHHILKHRGHFLRNVKKIESSQGNDSLVMLNDALKIIFSSSDDEEVIDEFVHKDKFLIILDIIKSIKKSIEKNKEISENLFSLSFIKFKKKATDEIVKAIQGKEFALSKLFDFPIEKGEKETKYSFDSNWEETKGIISQELDDDEFAVVVALNDTYNSIELFRLLGEENITFSEAMVKAYNKHHEDLKSLKSFIKTNVPDAYYKIFRSAGEYTETTSESDDTDKKKKKSKKGNYANYVGSNLSKGKQIVTKISKNDFYSFLKPILETAKLNIVDEEEKIKAEKMLSEIENGTFLQKLRTKNNSIIPFQLHLQELELILTNAAKYYSFLNQEDSDENSNIKSTKDKVLSLIKFRIPYYVGRLNTYQPEDGSRHVWAERLIKAKITPWTFDKIINKEASASNFIERMLNKCTYFCNETVLPKNSLLYSKFSVLNELNKLKFRGSAISPEMKQKIYTNLFEKNPTVTLTKLVKFYKTLDNETEKTDFGGVEFNKDKFNSNLSSYEKTREISNELVRKYDFNSFDADELIEKVILWQTLFTEKQMVEEKIISEYKFLKDNDRLIKKLNALNYSGFGKLSRKFLTDNFITTNTGEKTSIINLLWETNENLQEILYDKRYNIQEELSNYNDTSDEFSYQDIADSYASPSVKRATWESIKIIDELISLNSGKKPDKIFIEMTRSSESTVKSKKKAKGKAKKNKTISRSDFLVKLYSKNKIKDPVLLKELSEKSKNNDQMRSDKLYLYFLQFGKCAYSGDPINIDDLFNNNIYDIDHIIPQSLIKDDSLNNRVLAKKVLNSKKDNNYPLTETAEIRTNIGVLKQMWQRWDKTGAISRDKYDRLIRTTPLDTNELDRFINRQLVFTGQSATSVASLLKKKFSNKVEIVYSKAGNVSDFRQKFGIVKCREINDLHHAYDAYLNIVVGNVYNERFNHIKDSFREITNKYSVYNQNHLFEYDVKNAWTATKEPKPSKPKYPFLLSPEEHEMRKNDPEYTKQSEDYKNKVIEYNKLLNAWLEKSQSIQIVKETLKKQYYRVTKKVTETKGAFYDETINRVAIKQKQLNKNADLNGETDQKNSETKKIPLKTNLKNTLSNTSKYGYYKSIEYAYFMIIEHSIKSKTKSERRRSFVGVPLLYKNEIEKDIQLNGDKASFLTSKDRNGESNFVDPKIIIPKVYKFTLFEQNGTPIRLTGPEERQNAVQWYTDVDTTRYIKLLIKFINQNKKEETEIIDKESILVSGGGENNYSKAVITKDLNVSCFQGIKAQLEKEIYKGNTSLYKKITEKNIAKFNELSIYKQAKCILNLVKGLECNANRANLSVIGLTESFGRFSSSANAKITEPLVLVEESVTGIKTKRTQIFPFK